ncbi:MAG: FapA family protein [Oscillospiraceae bacterium]|nr:FapA family protein [Oscillospiraceae bacterium]
MAETNSAAKEQEGYAKDGEVIITILPNNSAAFMTLYPAVNGGREVTYEKAMAEIAAKSVRHNLKNDNIRLMIENKIYDQEFKIAEADMPVNGVDGTITYYYSRDNTLAPKEDEHGFVDYKDLGFIRNIRKNEVIAVITEPTPGTDGTDVRGITMKAIPGKKANYNIGMGTTLSEDGLSLIAATDGHIYFSGNAFCVDSSVTVNGDVDASIGNIDFIGDVIIKGEVQEGFSIVSEKNVTVAGNVSKSTIKAGGSITIKKGSINSGLTAGENITCQFAEYSNIYAEGDVKVNDFVVCDVHCGGNLTAKSLSGGVYRVIGDTEVKYLGTKTYAPTEVVAGDNALLTKELEDINHRIPELDNTIERCTQIVDFLNEKRKQLGRLPEDKEELMGTTVKTKLGCQMEKKKLKKRIAEINEHLELKQYKSVICKGTAYPGVKVTIDSETMKFETETTRVKIYLDDSGSIVTGQP